MDQVKPRSANKTCSLCQLLGPNDESVNFPNTEAAIDHARIHFIQSKLFDDGITEDQIFMRCFFGKPKVEVSYDAVSTHECRKTLLALSRSIIMEHPKAFTIACIMCGVEISVSQKSSKTKSMKTDGIINHARRHSKDKFYSCGHCDQSFNSKHRASMHLRDIHGIESRAADFENQTKAIFQPTLPDLIKRCFSNEFGPPPKQTHVIVRKNRLRELRELCTSIFEKRPTTTVADCNVCGLGISMRGKHMSIKVDTLVEHACGHLEIDLFKCGRCDQKFRSKRGFMAHFNPSHGFHPTVDDFEDESEKYKNDIFNMVKDCYTKRQGGLPSKEIASKLRGEMTIRNRTALSKFAMERHLLGNRLMRKFIGGDGRITCRACSVQLTVKFGGDLHNNAIIHHAELHVQRPLYRCNICAKSFATYSTIRRHLKKKHALGLVNNHETFADKFHTEIMAMMSQCFDVKSENLADPSLSLPPPMENASRRSLLAVCHSIFGKRPTASHATCNVCGFDIAHRANRGFLRTDYLMEHACSHLDVKLFKCHLCEHSSNSKRVTIAHLKRVHSAQGTIDDFDDRSIEFEAKISAVIKRCFAGKSETIPSSDDRARMRSEKSIRHQPTSSKFAIERQLFCNNLARKFIDAKGKLECRLCSKQTLGKTRSRGYASRPLIHHAEFHLQKPLYRCKICSKTCSTHMAVELHLRTEHALGFVGNHENFSDKFHSDILAMLSRCFDRDAD